jgi:PDZ domain-containing secreted protein
MSSSSSSKEWIEWRWTYGPNYQKSARRQKEQQIMEETPNIAIQQSLLSENDIWSLEEQQIFVKPLNKREQTYNKMATREMVGQIGMNPFSNNNYLTDVITQDNYLKPVSTTSEKPVE